MSEKDGEVQILGRESDSRDANSESEAQRERGGEEADGLSLNERHEETDERSDKEDKSVKSARGQDDSELDNDADDDRSLDSLDKLQNILNEITDQCTESLKNEDTEQALESLKRAEQILEDYTNEGKDVDRNMIIIVLYNQACCYQRLSMLEDCSNYLDGTIYNLQQKLLSFEDQE